jgi:hypothetical protein
VQAHAPGDDSDCSRLAVTIGIAGHAAAAPHAMPRDDTTLPEYPGYRLPA